MKKINSILLIDDNPADNEFHKIIISEANVCDRIEIALGGEQALSFLKKSMQQDKSGSFPEPMLIFLDINMHRMNGFEFLDEYKKLGVKSRSIVLIMLTTSLHPYEVQRAMAYEEVSGFLNKPLTVEIIQETVKKYF